MTLSGFDKTLFGIDSGVYEFRDTVVINVSMTWQPGEKPYMMNSIVSDVSAADLELTNSNVSDIFTNYSSPVVYIQNAAQNKILLNLTQSYFGHNVATHDAGVVYSLNTDVYVNNSMFIGNHALEGDGGALYGDTNTDEKSN